jgi:transposase
MSHWQIRVCEVISPLLLLLKAHTLSGQIINMDETTMKVMDEPDRENKQKSYMWIILGGPPGHKAAWYEYRTTRKADFVYDFLSEWAADEKTRYLQTDGYEGYDSAVKNMGGIKRVACLAHIRRKFYEASKLGVKSEAAESALAQIQNIYRIERKWRTLLDGGIITEKEFVELREHESLRLLVNFHLWQRKTVSETPPTSALGKAANYALEEWPAFVHYLEHWELTPDNNAAERAIRPFVMGRKNWVMSGSPDGAKTSCRLFSLIETAKLNGKNPYKYLTAVFTRAAEMPPSADWSKLLPWNLDC